MIGVSLVARADARDGNVFPSFTVAYLDVEAYLVVLGAIVLLRKANEVGDSAILNVTVFDFEIGLRA